MCNNQEVENPNLVPDVNPHTKNLDRNPKLFIPSWLRWKIAHGSLTPEEEELVTILLDPNQQAQWIQAEQRLLELNPISN